MEHSTVLAIILSLSLYLYICIWVGNFLFKIWLVNNAKDSNIGLILVWGSYAIEITFELFCILLTKCAGVLRSIFVTSLLLKIIITGIFSSLNGISTLIFDYSYLFDLFLILIAYCTHSRLYSKLESNSRCANELLYLDQISNRVGFAFAIVFHFYLAISLAILANSIAFCTKDPWLGIIIKLALSIGDVIVCMIWIVINGFAEMFRKCLMFSVIIKFICFAVAVFPIFLSIISFYSVFIDVLSELLTYPILLLIFASLDLLLFYYSRRIRKFMIKINIIPSFARHINTSDNMDSGVPNAGQNLEILANSRRNPIGNSNKDTGYQTYPTE